MDFKFQRPQIEVLLNPNLTYLYTLHVSGHFCAPMAELSACDRRCRAPKV